MGGASNESPDFRLVRRFLRSRIARLGIRLRKSLYARKPVNPRRILLFSVFGIGDALMQTPEIELLKKRFPESLITVVARRKNLEVFVHNQAVDEILLCHNHDFKGQALLEFWLNLKSICFSRGYDLALLDVAGGKLRGKVAAILFGARYIISDGLSAPEGNSLADELVFCGEGLHWVERNAALLENSVTGFESVPFTSLKPSIKFTNREIRTADEFFRLHHIDPNERVIACHVGSGGNLGIHKRWPLKRFLDLASGLKMLYPGGRIIVFKGPGEDVIDFKPFVEEGCIIAEGFTLLEVTALLRRATLFIGNDSGLAHLAASQDVPSVVLFGPTDEREVRPYGKHVRVVCRPMECRPCWGRKDYLQACGRGVDCLGLLDTDAVLRAVQHCLPLAKPGNPEQKFRKLL